MAHRNVPTDFTNNQAIQGQEFRNMLFALDNALAGLVRHNETAQQITDDADFAVKYGIDVADVPQLRSILGSAAGEQVTTNANVQFTTQLRLNYN